MNGWWKLLEHTLYASFMAAVVAFLQTLEGVGGQDFGQEPWWPIVVAGITFAISWIVDHNDQN